MDRNRVVHDHDEAVEEFIKKQNAIDDAMQAECERDVVPKFVRNKISTILEPRFECYVDVCVGDLLAAYFPQSGSFEIAVQYKVQKEYESRSGEIIKDKSSTSGPAISTEIKFRVKPGSSLSAPDVLEAP